MMPSNGAAIPLDERLFSDLHEQPGVTGVCLQSGSLVVTHNLPYSDDRVGDLAAHVERLCQSYETVGRGIWQILAGFESNWLLILSHRSLRLAILLQPNTDPTLIASRGTRFLMGLEVVQEAPPAAPVSEPPSPPVGKTWSRREFEDNLSGLLSRVAGQGTARKLIQRELEKSAVAGNDHFPTAEVERLGLAVLSSIPNRGKRSALTDEFLSMIKK
jgi:hypothetical protein